MVRQENLGGKNDDSTNTYTNTGAAAGSNSSCCSNDTIVANPKAVKLRRILDDQGQTLLAAIMSARLSVASAISSALALWCVGCAFGKVGGEVRVFKGSEPLDTTPCASSAVLALLAAVIIRRR